MTARRPAEIRSDLCEWQYLTEHPEHTSGPSHISHIMLRLATDVPGLLDELAVANQAIEDIRALHPAALCHVGTATHGGPEQYANGCARHGAFCETARILSGLSEHQEEAK